MICNDEDVINVSAETVLSRREVDQRMLAADLDQAVGLITCERALFGHSAKPRTVCGSAQVVPDSCSGATNLWSHYTAIRGPLSVDTPNLGQRSDKHCRFDVQWYVAVSEFAPHAKFQVPLAIRGRRDNETPTNIRASIRRHQQCVGTWYDHMTSARAPTVTLGRRKRRPTVPERKLVTIGSMTKSDRGPARHRETQRETIHNLLEQVGGKCSANNKSWK